jgi:hypothetical protein
VASRAGGWRLFTESRAGVFDDSVLSVPDGSYLLGYWQSERYFADIADTLRDEFRPRAPLSCWAAGVSAEIIRTGGVRLHDRRGDFAAEHGRRVHGAASLEYYRSATALLDEQLGNPLYFAFSDDPDWVAENLRLPRIRVVTRDDGGRHASAVEELALMASCRSHIIANSTFSWWGAWLADIPDGTVVAPVAWFSDRRLRSDDIVPARWIRI